MRIAFAVVELFLGLIFIVTGVGVTSYISSFNLGPRMENSLEARWENNKNISGNYALKIQEMAQIPEKYHADLKDVLTSALSSRYGKDGSQATLQFITEHATNLDPKMYQEIQQTIRAGREEFQQAQTQLLDEKAVYKNNLDYVWSG